jgi:hypothetical protein
MYTPKPASKSAAKLRWQKIEELFHEEQNLRYAIYVKQRFLEALKEGESLREFQSKEFKIQHDAVDFWKDDFAARQRALVDGSIRDPERTLTLSVKELGKDLDELNERVARQTQQNSALKATGESVVDAATAVAAAPVAVAAAVADAVAAPVVAVADWVDPTESFLLSSNPTALAENERRNREARERREQEKQRRREEREQRWNAEAEAEMRMESGTVAHAPTTIEQHAARARLRVAIGNAALAPAAIPVAATAAAVETGSAAVEGTADVASSVASTVRAASAMPMDVVSAVVQIPEAVVAPRRPRRGGSVTPAPPPAPAPAYTQNKYLRDIFGSSSSSSSSQIGGAAVQSQSSEVQLVRKIPGNPRPVVIDISSSSSSDSNDDSNDSDDDEGSDEEDVSTVPENLREEFPGAQKQSRAQRAAARRRAKKRSARKVIEEDDDKSFNPRDPHDRRRQKYRKDAGGDSATAATARPAHAPMQSSEVEELRKLLVRAARIKK